MEHNPKSYNGFMSTWLYGSGNFQCQYTSPMNTKDSGIDDEPMDVDDPWTGVVPMEVDDPWTGVVPMEVDDAWTGVVPMEVDDPWTGVEPMEVDDPWTGVEPMEVDDPWTGVVPMEVDDPWTGEQPMEVDDPWTVEPMDTEPDAVIDCISPPKDEPMEVDIVQSGEEWITTVPWNMPHNISVTRCFKLKRKTTIRRLRS